MDQCLDLLAKQHEIIKYSKVAEMLDKSSKYISENPILRERVDRAREEQQKQIKQLIQKEVNKFV